MGRLIKALLLLASMVLLVACMGVTVLVLASDGDPLDFVQTALLRLELASREAELNRPYGLDATDRRFVIAGGDTPRRIANNLVVARLISDATLFVDYVRVEGLDRNLQAGTYLLRQTQTIPQIAETLTDTRNSAITFRIIEGQRLEEIADGIDQLGIFGFSGDAFEAAVGPGAQVSADFAAWTGLPIGASLEGYLFPDTYLLPPDITAEALRDILLENFRQRVGEQLRTDALAQTVNGDAFTLHRAVTLASIVEREAVHNDENPLIAGVYRNRLRIGMLLQADPTVQYALNGSRGAWWPQITQADYRYDSDDPAARYNTYRYNNLPPGPIASPGLSAIQAAVYPAESDYIYFRARCDQSGYHAFALTFEAHVANACA